MLLSFNVTDREAVKCGIPCSALDLPLSGGIIQTVIWEDFQKKYDLAIKILPYTVKYMIPYKL